MMKLSTVIQAECYPQLDEFQTDSKTVKAIKLLQTGKAPGSDAIPAEIYKAGGPQIAEKTDRYFTLCGEKKPSVKDVPIIHLFKRKGNLQVFDNN